MPDDEEEGLLGDWAQAVGIDCSSLDQEARTRAVCELFLLASKRQRHG